jgi:hypothetical protein
VDPDALERLLTYLVARGVFTREIGGYANTEISRLLIDDFRWRQWLDLDNAPGIWAESWTRLLEAVRAGTPGPRRGLVLRGVGEHGEHRIDVPMPDMVELFVPAPDATVWAICSSGRLLRTAPDDWSWSSALPRDGVTVTSVAFPVGSAAP